LRQRLALGDEVETLLLPFLVFGSLQGFLLGGLLCELLLRWALDDDPEAVADVAHGWA
jgi:hypothetical protein